MRSQKLLAQRLVIGLLGVVAAAVFGLWLNSSFELLLSGLPGGLIALGQLLGLAAALAVLLQFMLMGRIKWVEGPFGLDRIAQFHRLNGYFIITLILVHPFLLTVGYSLTRKIDLVSQYVSFINSFPYVWLAVIAQLLLLGVATASVYIVRKRLKFETWYLVHLSVYVAIFLVFWHQINVGQSFSSHPLLRGLWTALYLFVATNVLYWRFSKVIIDYLRFRFEVAKVVHETDDVISIYIKVRGLARWKSQPGQFILVRFLTKTLVWQEHPFSMSQIPKEGCLRITVKNVGDYTALLQGLKPGTKLMVSGPFGSFTSALTANPKKLFLAGGIGLTPLVALMEEAGIRSDSVFLYGVRTKQEAVLMSELSQLIEPKRMFLLTSAGTTTGPARRISADLIAEIVPDYLSRDIYLCGPPVMMEAIVQQLKLKSFPLAHLHYERFSLHRQ